MSIPLVSLAPSILRPALGIFYFFVLLYFFVFTMWYEGGKDINRLNTGLIKKNMGKGFISAAIVAVPLCIIHIVPIFFPPEMKNLFATILGVLKVIFSMSSVFAVQIFIKDEVDITQGVGGNLESAYIAAFVYCGILLICVIGSGIGYIVGFKQIPIFKPWLDKWKD